MDGLTLLCAALAMICCVLLGLGMRRELRIRHLTDAINEFLNGTEKMVDIALQEDSLAALQNGIADLQQAVSRARLLKAEECTRTSQLTADISHQLKTPLTTLRLYTEMDDGAHMEVCLEQIQRMEALIQSLLRLERLCADGYPFTFAEADVQAVITEQWQGLQDIWPEKRLELTGSARIRCDARWLGEAFLNLLKNACEHTVENGVITVQLERSESAFFCTIEDNGGGVAPEELPKLFHRFYRAEHQSKNGAGIGLAIVKEIIERHHGIITAENGSKGLRMTIVLPMLDRNLTNL